MKHLAGVLERVKTPISALAKSQRGVTGLETAIILIAFVVVASVFAFTVLSTGIFSSEKGKETIHAGLKEARSSIELRGAVVGYGVADLELSDADTVWTRLTNVTATRDNLDKKEGSYSGELVIASGKTGLLAYENVTGFLDLSAHDSLEFWVKSSVTIAAGVLEIGFDQDDNCSSLEENIDVPALTANTWKLVTVGITATTTRTSVDCVGFYAASALSSSSSVTLNFDQIIARGQLNTLVITLANALGGDAVDVSPPSDSDNDGLADSDIPHKLILHYQDANQRLTDLYWTRNFVGTNDGDNLLEENEKVDLTISLRGLAQATPLTRNLDFEIELRPQGGGVLLINRTTPDRIDAVTNLN